MELEIRIREAEFTCRCCGECCSGKNNEVMVSPDEIDLLCETTGLTHEQITEPHICRTYPFMLDGKELLVFECCGCKIGEPTPDTEQIAKDLLIRQNAEDKEFLLTKEQYQKHSMVLGSIIIFDSRGAHLHKQQ